MAEIDLNAPKYPWELMVGANDSLYVGDYGNGRMITLVQLTSSFTSTF